MKRCRFAGVSFLLVLVTMSVSNASNSKESTIESELRLSIQSISNTSSFVTGNLDDFDFQDENKSASTRKNNKSTFRAGLYSALIPGAGEYYLGHKRKARVFFVADVLTWVGFASFRIYSGWKKDDFIRLATVGADAQLEGKSNDFHDMVGFFDSIDDANTAGRISNPEREFLEDTPENHWRWIDSNDRLTFRSLKNRSREASRKAEFMIGLAIVNRIVSVVDAVITAKRDDRKIETDFASNKTATYSFKIDPMSRHRQLNFTYFTNF